MTDSLPQARIQYSRKTTFALFFGNRGFFPEKLISGARAELIEVLEGLGHDVLVMPEDATDYGAVESPADGAKYANFLKENKGKFSGVILCLPNFGDETGAIAALRDAEVPIYIQAYPDEITNMGFEDRRDAFCGKFSVMDVFTQYGTPFTSWTPHVVHPRSETFRQHMDQFDRTCRVVGGMKRMVVGAIGARTTAFKTVRFDELTLQKYDITTETLDMSDVFMRVRGLDTKRGEYLAKAEKLRGYTNWKGVPDKSFDMLVRTGVVIDDIIEEYEMNAMAFRCWIEIEKELNISPCVLLSEINDRGIPAACELDTCNAISMYAINLASQAPATCLDWNNNWGDDENKCILFHCGPVPQTLMTGKGDVIDHPMFAKALGSGCGWGCNVGRIANNDITFASCKTQDGRLEFYLGEGEFTKDVIPPEYFGCAGVVQIDNLQNKLQKIGYEGYRHHVSVTTGHVAASVREAFDNYLNYSVTPW